MQRSWHAWGWRRFLLEYVGNVDVEVAVDLADVEPPSIVSMSASAPTERRKNYRGREMVDWFKQEMTDRRFSIAKRTELLEGVREVVRSGDTVHSDSRIAEEVDRE